MKSAIYEFDPVIYPIRLWVSKKPNVEFVSSLFYPCNNDGEVVADFDGAFSGIGVSMSTVLVVLKKSSQRGCLVAILWPNVCGAGVCSHEALHFVAYVAGDLGIKLGDFEYSEPLAYLEQWATNCIWSVLTGHPEKMKGVKVE